jgi:predicted HTH transcriptional regulator
MEPPSTGRHAGRSYCLQDAINAQPEGVLDKTRVETQVKTRVKTPEQIVALLQQNPNMTLSEVADAIGKSVSAVGRAVAKLKMQNKLAYHGPKKGGYWICPK